VNLSDEQDATLYDFGHVWPEPVTRCLKILVCGMGKFRSHQYFAKSKDIQAFRFPFVCLACRKSFKYPVKTSERRCPQCGGGMVMLSRKFSAPRSKDMSQWEKIRFLVEHGFRFYPVYEPSCGGMLSVRYPATLSEAKTFVQRFSAQKVKQVHTNVAAS